MSRVTPEEEYAAGIVSCASQAPFAYWKKSVQALTVVSIQWGSMTRSGLRSESVGATVVGEVPWATMRADNRASAARRPRSWRVRAANNGASIGGDSEWREGRKRSPPSRCRQFRGGQFSVRSQARINILAPAGDSPRKLLPSTEPTTRKQGPATTPPPTPLTTHPTPPHH